MKRTTSIGIRVTFSRVVVLAATLLAMEDAVARARGWLALVAQARVWGAPGEMEPEEVLGGRRASSRRIDPPRVAELAARPAAEEPRLAPVEPRPAHH